MFLSYDLCYIFVLYNVYAWIEKVNEDLLKMDMFSIWIYELQTINSVIF